MALPQYMSPCLTLLALVSATPSSPPISSSSSSGSTPRISFSSRSNPRDAFAQLGFKLHVDSRHNTVTHKQATMPSYISNRALQVAIQCFWLSEKQVRILKSNPPDASFCGKAGDFIQNSKKNCRAGPVSGINKVSRSLRYLRLLGCARPLACLFS